jgi:hypothetical protein
MGQNEEEGKGSMVTRAGTLWTTRRVCGDVKKAFGTSMRQEGTCSSSRQNKCAFNHRSRHKNEYANA